MTDAFDLLQPRLRSLVRGRFPRPTAIQQEAIPRVLEGGNLLLISETGSGKTESVLLPVFSQLLAAERKPIAILYITPLKSLNRDLLKRLVWWGEKLDFEVAVRHGDTSPYERSMQAANPSHLLISTPETLQAMLVGKVMRQHLANVKWVIIDEIHELVDSKRGIQLALGLERLKQLAGPVQIIALSATVGSPQTVASFLGNGFSILDAAKEKRLQLTVNCPGSRPEDAANAKKAMISKETASRVREIRDRITGRTATLVFTNTRESAEVLSSRLKLLYPALPLEAHHSSLSKEVRIAAERDFKEQRLKALLCTSSLELGIDIGAIDFVLQFLSPRQVMKLLQRVGRAGHAVGRVSEGMIIAGDADDCFESAVIARHAVERKIEQTAVYEKALDVLGHQLVGLTLEQDIPLDKAFQLVRQAYPYRSLTEEEFFAVCRLMERLGTLWINDRDPAFAQKYASGETRREDRFKGKLLSDLILRRRRNSWLYYYQNLSTIPDVRTYKVQDVFTNQPVGSLDAEFIAMHGGPGQGVIVKGQAWRILDVGEGKVMVEPMAGVQAAIPAWEGDLIPVPFDIAQGVGRLRREIAEALREKRDPTAAVMASYPVSRGVARKLVAAAKQQLAWGPLPTDRELLVEYDQERIILHTCWGSLVNDTIGRTLSVLLTGKIGSIGLHTDPYRIILTTAGFGWRDAAEAFMDLRPDQIRRVLRDSLPLTELFHWRFLHVAKRLGIIARDAEFGKGYLRKVIEAYTNTPVHEETFNEIEQDKLDIEKAAGLLQQVRAKRLAITVREGISPLGRTALDRRYEVVPPERPEQEIFGMFKDRLLETKVGLICCHCGDWATIMDVGSLPEALACAACGAKLVSVVPKRYLLEAQELIRKHKAGRRLTAEERRWLDLTMDTASLVLEYGRGAAIALAGRGVGPKTAARILAKLQEGDALLRNILEAERNFVKTRRFWK